MRWSPNAPSAAATPSLQLPRHANTKQRRRRTRQASRPDTSDAASTQLQPNAPLRRRSPATRTGHAPATLPPPPIATFRIALSSTTTCDDGREREASGGRSARRGTCRNGAPVRRTSQTLMTLSRPALTTALPTASRHVIIFVCAATTATACRSRHTNRRHTGGAPVVAPAPASSWPTDLGTRCNDTTASAAASRRAEAATHFVPNANSAIARAREKCAAQCARQGVGVGVGVDRTRRDQPGA